MGMRFAAGMRAAHVCVTAHDVTDWKEKVAFV
eukprot:CAMPEP_0171317154 /NCGR_PEP_ID=MMETSP0816-20121228/78479_1 /TAXON_ID=420281 /ORGANISM="Proboscia inermis, Strain CCAP1064/1" /LENGTH=31 /DNA_ID= /DNA_START= /DNA_END= /DNA_ORIENTATION=